MVHCQVATLGIGPEFRDLESELARKRKVLDWELAGMVTTGFNVRITVNFSTSMSSKKRDMTIFITNIKQV